MVTVTGNTAEFSFFRPQARQVRLAGDFNRWCKDELTMIRNPDGHWLARLQLPEGEFRFRYCADGEWFADYAAFGLEFGPYGADSLLRVGPSLETSDQANRAREDDAVLEMALGTSLAAQEKVA